MPTSEDVLGTALQLPPDERARVAHGLLLSLDEEPSEDVVNAEWGDEILRRLDDIRSGRVTPLDWSVVRDEILSSLEKRTEA